MESVPVLIDVERADLPTSISPSTPSIMLGAPAETASFMILATFADGSVLDVTQSSHVTYSVTDNTIVIIDANGIVTAVSPGTAFVTGKYTINGVSLPAAIPVSVATPTLAPSAFSLVFGSQTVGTSSAPQRLTLTNMASAPVRVLSLSTTGNFSETDNCISSSPLAPGGNCIVDVTFSPAVAGVRPGRLLISNGSDIARTTIVLSGATP